jgi:hypothetical protein
MKKKKSISKTTYGFQVFQINVGGGTVLEMREVMYENGVPVLCTASATTVNALTIEGMKSFVAALQEATLKPILSESDQIH